MSHKKSSNDRINIPERTDVLRIIEASQNKLYIDDVLELLCEDAAQRTPLSSRINAMLRDQQLIMSEEGTLHSNAGAQRTGRVSGHPKGFGFLLLDGEDDWFISDDEMKRCIPGEIVVATPKKKTSVKTFARIVKQTTLLTSVVGQITKSNRGISVVLDGKRNIPILLENDDENITDGAWVCFDFTQPPSGPKPYTAFIHKVLSAPSENDLIRFRALQKNGFGTEYSHELSRQAMDLCVNTPRCMNDMRHIPFISVDGASSRDLDDLVYINKRECGGYRLIVAIADVSRYVPVNSPLDLAAQAQGSTVYTAGQSFPMFPDIISHDVCSLLPEADRDAFVVDMLVDKNGCLESYRFTEARVRSAHRFSYTRLQNIFDGQSRPTEEEAVHNDTINTLFDLQNKRIACREERGSCFIGNDEQYAIFSESGTLDRFETAKLLRAHSVIEEAMVLTNVASAQYLFSSCGPGFYRHHPSLQEKELGFLNEFLAERGVPPLDINATGVEGEKKKERLSDPDVLEYDRLLRKCQTFARYHTCNSDHYGLSLPHYTHFTSPIRRYPDLVVHRLIKAIMEKEGAVVTGACRYSKAELSSLAYKLTEQGRQASLVEREVMDKICCSWLKNKTGQRIKGTVRGLSAKMVFIHIHGTPVDGSMTIEHFTEHYNKAPKIGDTTSCVLKECDVERGRIALEA